MYEFAWSRNSAAKVILCYKTATQSRIKERYSSLEGHGRGKVKCLKDKCYHPQKTEARSCGNHVVIIILDATIT